MPCKSCAINAKKLQFARSLVTLDGVTQALVEEAQAGPRGYVAKRVRGPDGLYHLKVVRGNVVVVTPYPVRTP
jgi:hypothetical protein